MGLMLENGLKIRYRYDEGLVIITRQVRRLCTMSQYLSHKAELYGNQRTHLILHDELCHVRRRIVQGGGHLLPKFRHPALTPLNMR